MTENPTVGARRPTIDAFLHQPARLSLMALLAPAEWVDFGFLRDSLETTDSALSKQVAALEDVGYVELRKESRPRRRTVIRMSDAGRAAFAAYIDTLERIVAEVRGGPPV
ncbi:winged helix-turn-helix domain-containing protein [Spongisporangium articulatum]|uniref:Winged helix-turn-helix domain-containing protein n=1 Tax=Spongisporangium articulatum TaxID=3362603 RepID=A0ABW8AGY3_9ACTN